MRGKEAEKIKSEAKVDYKPKSKLALAHGLLWVYSKTANGSQLIMEAIAEVPDAILEYYDQETDSLIQLNKSIEYWQKFINLEGFDLLPTDSQREYARLCHKYYNKPDWWVLEELESAQTEIENIKNTPIEQPTSTKAPETSTETIMHTSDTVADSNLLADQFDIVQVNSVKDADLQVIHQHTHDETVASLNKLNSLPKLVIDASTLYDASIDTPKTLSDATTTVPEQLPKADFRAYYKLDDQAYDTVCKIAAKEDYWTDIDGIQWSRTGKKDKTVWHRVLVTATAITTST